jgi:hypothetical protein
MAIAPALRRVPGLSSVLLLGHQLPVLGEFEPAFLIQRADGFCGLSATLIRILAELICAIIGLNSRMQWGSGDVVAGVRAAPKLRAPLAMCAEVLGHETKRHPLPSQPH